MNSASNDHYSVTVLRLKEQYNNLYIGHAYCADLSNVPVVVLVLEGGHMTLNTAYQAIKTETPVLVLAGSGRAADFIASAYEKPLVTVISLN